MSNPPGFPGPSNPQRRPASGQPASFGAPPPAPFGPGQTGPPAGFGPPNNTGNQPGWLPDETPPSGGGKTGLVIGLIAAVVVAATVAFLITRDDDEEEAARSASSQAQEEIEDLLATTPTIPDITIPDITIPDITIPDITIPDITIPEITIPEITIPELSIPELPPLPTTSTSPGAVPPQTSRPATTVSAPDTSAPEAGNLFTGTQAADVVAEVAAARGASPLRILHVLLYPEYAFAQVQDPAIPANVDEYQWRGSLGSPVPVRLTGDGDLEAKLFSDTDVNWAAVPALVDAALAQIPIEGAEVTHISIQRNLPFTDAVQIRVFVNGTRTSGYLDADAQGNIIEVNQG